MSEVEVAARRALDRLVGGVARRERGRRAVVAAWAGLPVAGAVAAVGILAVRALGGAPDAAWLGVAGALVVVAAAIGAARPVSLQVVAKRVEDVHGEAAPVAASLEVAARGARNRVERALLATAPVWAERVHARAVVPRPRAGRWAWWTVPAWSAVAIALALPWPTVGPAPRATTPMTDLGGAWRVDDEEAVVKLERFADLLYREAEARDDERVREVAARAAALAERLRRGGVEATDASAAVEALVGEATTSLGYADDPTYRAGDGAGDDAVGAGARPATNRERAAETFGQDRREDIGTTRAPQDGERVLDSLLERLETEAIARATAAPGADLSEVQFRPGAGTTDAGDAFQNPYEDPNAGAPLEGTPAADGARPDLGGAAVGDAAGMGGAEAGRLAQAWTEGRDPQRALDALDVDLEQVALPDRPQPGARRLRVLAPPATGSLDVVSDGPVGPPPAWAWREEAFLGGFAVDPADRRVLALARRPGAEEVP